MGRSSGLTTTVKVPVMWDAMTERQKTRLSRITSRDTSVIKAYLGVIERHESELLTGKKNTHIDAGAIDKLTLRTSGRPEVEHDFKARFTNISVNELQECRETATAMWQVYLSLRGKRPMRARGYRNRKLPRHVFSQRFELVYTPEKSIKHWLSLRDSLDSTREKRRVHDRLMIPLSSSSYHLQRLRSGEIKSVQIVKDHARKWWALFKVRLDIDEAGFTGKPPAVLGIDLGVKRAVCSVLLTQHGIKQVRYWKQEDKAELMEHYDETVASLQKQSEELLRAGRSADSVTRKLRTMSRKRENISFDHDNKLVSMLSEHVHELSEQYSIYVAVGRLKGIRNRARRGNGTGKAYRGMINRWSFARITDSLRYKLRLLGLDSTRVYSVPEGWTSIRCHRCGHTGLRPRQSLFVCHTCGFRDNADRNGAINIGRRLIRLIPYLRDEKGLGMWLLPEERAAPNARRSASSHGKSSLPQRSPESFKGESVADCHEQTTLEESVSSTDRTMENTMETPSAALTSGGQGNERQRTEAQSEQRSNAPVRLGERHAHPVGEVPLVAGDGGHDEG